MTQQIGTERLVGTANENGGYGHPAGSGGRRHLAGEAGTNAGVSLAMTQQIGTERLVGTANENGGYDNISVILLEAVDAATLRARPGPTREYRLP